MFSKDTRSAAHKSTHGLRSTARLAHEVLIAYLAGGSQGAQVDLWGGSSGLRMTAIIPLHVSVMKSDHNAAV